MRWSGVTLAFLCLLSASPVAQTRGGAPVPGAVPPTSARMSAPTDVTGYWVSLITEDWRWRMIMPAKGDYQSVPITPEAKRAADNWDPAKDEAAGEACRAYGAAGIMRLPTRLRVSWADPLGRTQLHLTWEDVGAFEYRVYAGSVLNMQPRRGAASYDHARFACGLASADLVAPPPPGRAPVYFLAVAANCDGVESSYGRDSFAVERPDAAIASGQACP